MPSEFTKEVEEFRIWTVADYFEEVTRAESNDYRAENPDLAWKIIGDAMRRIAERDWNYKREICKKTLEL